MTQKTGRKWRKTICGKDLSSGLWGTKIVKAVAWDVLSLKSAKQMFFVRLKIENHMKEKPMREMC